MGCSKNLVDAERLMKRLSDCGYDVRFEERPEETDADTVIINTCGFIGDAKEQSINEILLWSQMKSEGQIRRVYVMGCLSERYRSELPAEIPEVDGWFGKFDWDGVVGLLSRDRKLTLPFDRRLTTPTHHAFLKISEGCNRFCAFCAIPLITGRHHSRPIDEVVAEVKLLVQRGVKEFNVIAQDLSAYGTDFDGKSRLAELIDAIADVDGVKWIRLHYAYPADFPMDVIDVMQRRPNVCHYLDIALQHGSDKMLTAMRRHIDMESTRRLLSEIRRRVPDIHIRTTMMTGFPGEDDNAFEELMAFVAEQRFERLGAFTYCEEEGTYAEKNLGDPIPQEIKQARLDKLMALQEKIATEIAESKVGTVMRVVIDREENDFYVGRSQWDSPDVDPEVLVSKETPLKIGEFYDVAIKQAMPFELIGNIV